MSTDACFNAAHTKWRGTNFYINIIITWEFMFWSEICFEDRGKVWLTNGTPKPMVCVTTPCTAEWVKSTSTVQWLKLTSVWFEKINIPVLIISYLISWNLISVIFVSLFCVKAIKTSIFAKETSVSSYVTSILLKEKEPNNNNNVWYSLCSRYSWCRVWLVNKGLCRLLIVLFHWELSEQDFTINHRS